MSDSADTRAASEHNVLRSTMLLYAGHSADSNALEVVHDGLARGTPTLRLAAGATRFTLTPRHAYAEGFTLLADGTHALHVQVAVQGKQSDEAAGEDSRSEERVLLHEVHEMEQRKEYHADVTQFEAADRAPVNVEERQEVTLRARVYHTRDVSEFMARFSERLISLGKVIEFVGKLPLPEGVLPKVLDALAEAAEGDQRIGLGRVIAIISDFLPGPAWIWKLVELVGTAMLDKILEDNVRLGRDLKIVGAAVGDAKATELRPGYYVLARWGDINRPGPGDLRKHPDTWRLKDGKLLGPPDEAAHPGASGGPLTTDYFTFKLA